MLVAIASSWLRSMIVSVELLMLLLVLVLSVGDMLLLNRNKMIPLLLVMPGANINFIRNTTRTKHHHGGPRPLDRVLRNRRDS